MYWSILCDFDGIISFEDVIDLLLEKYGQLGWQDLEDQWKVGKIGLCECMQGQVWLLVLDLVMLDVYLDQVQIDLGFVVFVVCVEQLGLLLCIVSDGLDYVIYCIFVNYGLLQLLVVVNYLCWCGDYWELELFYQVEGCCSGICKCICVVQVCVNEVLCVLMIGDGSLDFCVFEDVDFVFVKCCLIIYCIYVGIDYVVIDIFYDVIVLLLYLFDGSLLQLCCFDVCLQFVVLFLLLVIV